MNARPGSPSRMRLEIVERHLIEDSPLVDEVCVLPNGGPDGLDGCRAVVVPNADEISSQKVSTPVSRLLDEVAVSAWTAPIRVRVKGVIVVNDPLPRTAQGRLAREVIAEQAAAWPYCEDAQAAATQPAAQRCLDRLQQVMRFETPCRPEQHLERDLGLSSLDLVNLRLVLEEEFGVVIRDDEVWRVQSVGDVLQRVVAVDAPPREPASATYTWAERVREPPLVSLDERFNMNRGGLPHLASEFAMRTLDFASRLAFRTELVHPERLPTKGPFLLCPTHASMLDSVLVYAAFPNALVQRMVFVAFGPYFRSPPRSWIVKPGRLILTAEADSTTESLRLAWEAFQRDWSVCIFPEGNCSYTGSVMPARPGVGLLSCQAQVPIVPVLYSGSSGTFSPLKRGFHPTKIRIVIGEPIQPPKKERFVRTDYQALADRWRASVMALQANERAR